MTSQNQQKNVVSALIGRNLSSNPVIAEVVWPTSTLAALNNGYKVDIQCNVNYATSKLSLT